MDRLTSDGLDDLKFFIKNSNLARLKVLYLHGNSNMELSKLKYILPSLLKIVTEQIFIDSFILSEQILNTIFENSINSERLVLVNCQIGDIGETFVIRDSAPYKMRELDLTWTCIKDNDSFLSEDKLSLFFRALAKTQLKQSLKFVHVDEEDYDGDELHQIMKDNDFNVPVRADDKQPMPIQ